MSKRRGNISELLEKIDANQMGTVRVVSWDQGVQDFIDEMDLKNLAFHTKRWHRENLHYVKETLLKLNLPTIPSDITESNLKQCILYWKRECSLSPTTINHRIRSIKQLYKSLINSEVISFSPADRLSKLKAPKLIIRPFEEDEVRRLLNQPDKATFVGYRDYVIMLLLLDTGVRISELVSIKMDDVDPQGGKVKVWGKGAKEREVIFQNTTKRFLCRYIQLKGSTDHEYLWITDTGNQINPRLVQERLSIYGRQAGLDSVRVSPHTFRHTCAKMYIMRGGDILSLQKLLGHSSLEMVRHYVDLWGSDLRQMHKKFSPVEGLFRSDAL